MIENSTIIDAEMNKILEIKKLLSELENRKMIGHQDTLLSFKFLPNNEKLFAVSGNIKGIITLNRTLIQALVEYGHTKQKLEVLQFPNETLTNSDCFMSAINIVDNFFEIEKIKVATPTLQQKKRMITMYLFNTIWKVAKAVLIVLGLLYLIQVLIFSN